MRDRGFTLLEVIVALGILSTGAVAVAQLMVVTTDAMHTARVRTSTVMLSTARLEELRSLRWSFDAAANRIADASTDLSFDPPGSGGAGLSISPAGSLDLNMAGYVDYLDANGRWIAPGPAQPANAVYVRRWSIERPADGSPDTLVLQVVTRPVAEDASSGTARPAVTRGEARLMTLLTRVAP